MPTLDGDVFKHDMPAARTTYSFTRAPFRGSAFATPEELIDLEEALERITARRKAIDSFYLAGPQPLLIDGICQACGASRRFRGDAPAGRSFGPSDWPLHLCCVNCGLNTQQRACVHFLLAETGRDLRNSVVRVDGDDALAGWLGERLGNVPGAARPFADVLVSLAHTPGGLAAKLKQLRPGGRLITPVEGGEAVWALKAVLADHGLVDWRGHLYWSEEFGYLGPANVLVTASFR